MIDRVGYPQVQTIQNLTNNRRFEEASESPSTERSESRSGQSEGIESSNSQIKNSVAISTTKIPDVPATDSPAPNPAPTTSQEVNYPQSSAKSASSPGTKTGTIIDLFA